MAERRTVEEVKSAIIDTLKTLEGERIDVCYRVYELITSIEGKAPELLRFFYENSEMLDSSEAVRAESVISDEERRTLEEDYGKLINSTLEAIIRKKLTVDEFYRTLWKTIDENPIFEDEKTKAFAVYFIWIDARVPYYQLEPGMKMSNDDFFEIIRKKLDDIKKIRFILTAPMEQRTERASILLKLLNDCNDEKEKTVLMAQILAINSRFNQLDTEKGIEE